MSSETANFASNPRSATPNSPAKKRGCGCLGWVSGAILLAVAVTLLLRPWALHMGGRWTPTLTWHGIGALHSSTGASYSLFTKVSVAASRRGRGSGSSFGRKNLQGIAIICTPQGVGYPLTVDGYLKDAWLDADGKPVTFYLRSPKDAAPKLNLILLGQWKGQELQLEDRGNFAMSFAVDGHAKGYLQGANSPSESTSGSLHYATESEFSCGRKGGSSIQP